MGNETLNGRAEEQLGALKIHEHEDHLPGLDDLILRFKRVHKVGRNIAAHCVTRSEIMLILAAFEEAGTVPGDRLEHAAIADMAIIERIVRLGLSVVTQPHFLANRSASYLREVEPAERDYLWPLGSFLHAEIPLALGSDAPFEAFDPWRVMQAAVMRPTGFGKSEAITPEAALALYTKPASDASAPSRKIRVGAIADMIMLDRNWSQARENLSKVKVINSWIDGTPVYSTS